MCIRDSSLTVKRQLEDGYMELKVQTPCLLTCIKELNTPRYMSVPGIFECYSKPYEVFGYETLKDDPLIDPTTIGLKAVSYTHLDVYKRQAEGWPNIIRARSGPSTTISAMEGRMSTDTASMARPARRLTSSGRFSAVE